MGIVSRIGLSVVLVVILLMMVSIGAKLEIVSAGNTVLTLVLGLVALVLFLIGDVGEEDE